MLRTKSVWIDRKTDGLRILVTRIRGRGLPASRYDVWMANLGPSERLLRAAQRGKMSSPQFANQYRTELFLDGPIDKRSRTIKNHGQKFTLRLVKELAQRGRVTLLLNGVPARSCITPISSVGDAAITTIEGIDASEVSRRVKAAWLALEVVQCGYCRQSGQVLAATALLTHNPRPSNADIDQAMIGNLCRCATYTRIRAAIKQAAGLPTTDTREV
jgi:isoquinoline 1-oxidoreductase subunit alpha